MGDISKKLDAIIDLTPVEHNAIFRAPKIKSFRFEPESFVEPIHNHQLSISLFQYNALKFIICEGIKQADLFLLKFPQHEKPPQHVFVNTISAFIQRRAVNQLEYDMYYNWNLKDLNSAKLHVEYSTFIKYSYELLETLENYRSFNQFQINVNEMLELEKYMNNLEKENVDNIEHLRKQEMELVKLCQINQSSKEFKVLDDQYHEVENDYHDTRVIIARQRRYTRNLFNSQLDQIKKQESKKTNDMVDETNVFLKNYDTESVVFDESAKYNMIMIEEHKEEITMISQKYDNDLITIEFEITKAQSELNYFEEMWEQKQLNLLFMEKECENYIESVRQRKREAIAKRLAQPWIASARKTIADQKKKAKRLAKKNKKKK